ncbi:MAG: AEC family transporter [Caulobacteraceae bacterium]
MGMLIASALVPVFFVMALGFFAGKRGIIDNVNIKALNNFLMMFALPAALFTAIARTPGTVIVSNASLMLVLAICLLALYAVMGLLQYVLFKLSKADAAVLMLTAAFPNFSSIGLPLLVGIYGPEAALAVAVAIATGAVTISPLTLTLLELAKAEPGSRSGFAQFLGALRKSVSKPIFLAPMLAVILALAGFQIPALVDKTLSPIGAATAGAGLFLTGLILSAQPIRITRDVVIGVVLKNILQPLLAVLLVYLLRIPQPLAGEAVLLVCIPAGFFGLVFGAGYGARPAVAGSTLVVSSVASIVTLAIAVALLAPLAHHP